MRKLLPINYLGMIVLISTAVITGFFYRLIPFFSLAFGTWPWLVVGLILLFTKKGVRRTLIEEPKIESTA